MEILTPNATIYVCTYVLQLPLFTVANNTECYVTFCCISILIDVNVFIVAWIPHT